MADNKLKDCNECKWKFVAYRGKTCPDEEVCDDFESLPKHFSFAEVKYNDTFLGKLNAKMKEPSFHIDKTVIRELEQMYVATAMDKERELRFLPTDMEDIEANKQVGRLLEETQAKKDRVIRLWTGYILLKNSVGKMHRAGEKYLYRKYLKELTDLKNEAIRKIVIEDMLSDVSEKYERIKSLMDTCELIHKNLSDTYYTLARLKEIGESVLGRKTEH